MTDDSVAPRDEASSAPGGREAPKGCSLPAVVAISVVVGVLFGFFYSALAAARERARRTKCSSNLHSLNYACQLYSGDNEERYPSDFEVLFSDYVTDGEIFLCPSASKATELLMRDFRLPGSSDSLGAASVHPEHMDYVLVSGLTASDPPEYILLFEDEWNHDGDVVHADTIGGRRICTSDIKGLHEQLAKQKKELAARGREMKLIRPAWSSWPDPSASGDPRAGPRPWHRRRIGSAVFFGASAALIVALVVAFAMVKGKSGTGEAGPAEPTDGGAGAESPTMENDG